MESTRLGRTGLKVSRLCLGTMTFGLQCDEPTSVAILDRAVEGGITFIDTADVYPLGGTLSTVGRTVRISSIVGLGEAGSAAWVPRSVPRANRTGVRQVGGRGIRGCCMMPAS